MIYHAGTLFVNIANSIAIAFDKQTKKQKRKLLVDNE